MFVFTGSCLCSSGHLGSRSWPVIACGGYPRTISSPKVSAKGRVELQFSALEVKNFVSSAGDVCFCEVPYKTDKEVAGKKYNVIL